MIRLLKETDEFLMNGEWFYCWCNGQWSMVGQLLLGASVLAHPMTPYSLNWGVEERSDERE